VTSKHAFAFGLALALGITSAVPAALAGKPGGGGTGGKCTRKPPRIAVDNTCKWGAWGSWGTAGQQLTYAMNVMNYDVGCRSSNFVVGVSAPSGFSTAVPTNTLTVKSSSSRYVYASVTSPATAAEGDYPLAFTVRRAGGSDGGTFTSYYKVYSSDSAAPTLYWVSPGDGARISGASYIFSVTSEDDHAVKRIELYVDGTYRSTTVCDNVAYNCQMHAPTSVQGQGQHTATFKSYDWFGNIGTLTVGFTVA
jgi:Bacterial Ig domain